MNKYQKTYKININALSRLINFFFSEIIRIKLKFCICRKQKKYYLCASKNIKEKKCYLSG